MRKLLSVLTVLAIILCLMTTVAFAEDKYLLIGSGGITVADDKYTYGNDNGVIAGYENVDMQDTLPEGCTWYACKSNDGYIIVIPNGKTLGADIGCDEEDLIIDMCNGSSINAVYCNNITVLLDGGNRIYGDISAAGSVVIGSENGIKDLYYAGACNSNDITFLNCSVDISGCEKITQPEEGFGFELINSNVTVTATYGPFGEDEAQITLDETSSFGAETIRISDGVVYCRIGNNGNTAISYQNPVKGKDLTAEEGNVVIGVTQVKAPSFIDMEGKTITSAKMGGYYPKELETFAGYELFVKNNCAFDLPLDFESIEFLDIEVEADSAFVPGNEMAKLTIKPKKGLAAGGYTQGISIGYPEYDNCFSDLEVEFEILTDKAYEVEEPESAWRLQTGNVTGKKLGIYVNNTGKKPINISAEIQMQDENLDAEDYFTVECSSENLAAGSKMPVTIKPVQEIARGIYEFTLTIKETSGELGDSTCYISLIVSDEAELPEIAAPSFVDKDGDEIESHDFGDVYLSELDEVDQFEVYLKNNCLTELDISHLMEYNDLFDFDVYTDRDIIEGGGVAKLTIMPKSDLEVGDYEYNIPAGGTGAFQNYRSELIVRISVYERGLALDGEVFEWDLQHDYSDNYEDVISELFADAYLENTSPEELAVNISLKGDTAAFIVDYDNSEPLAAGDIMPINFVPKKDLEHGVYNLEIVISTDYDDVEEMSIKIKMVIYANLNDGTTKAAGNVSEDIDIDEIEDALKDSDFKFSGSEAALAEKMLEKLLEESNIADNAIKGTPVLLDIVPQVSDDGGSTWHDADDDDEEYFVNGEVPVSLGMNENGIAFDPATEDIRIIHVFTTDLGGNTPGESEWFSTNSRDIGRGAGSITVNGDKLEFTMSGCSPIYVVTTAKGATVGGYGDGNIVLSGPFTYDSDADLMLTPDEDNAIGSNLEYGEPVYYLVLDVTEGGVPLTDHKFTEKLKAKAEWSMGESIIENVSIVKKYVDVDYGTVACNQIITDADSSLGSDYYYFLEIKTKEIDSTSETDVQGVIEFDRKANSKKSVQKIKNSKADVDFTVFYSNNWSAQGEVVGDEVDLEWDTKYALKFNSDDEVELSFGSPNGGNNEGTFTVDVSGQGKVVLCYNTNPIETIANANPDADMDFIIFNDVKFNRVGEFVYEKENGTHAYRVVNGKLVEINGLTVDGGEFKFNTSILGGYVFADRELVNP